MEKISPINVFDQKDITKNTNYLELEEVLFDIEMRTEIPNFEGDRNIINKKKIDLLIQHLIETPQDHIAVLRTIKKFEENETCINRMKKNLENILKEIKTLADKKVNNTMTAKERMKYYILSCVLGAFLGDSIGSFCEFSKRGDENHSEIWSGMSKIHKSSNGQITDDSEMALSLAYAILDSKNIFEIDQNNIAYYYGLWMLTNPQDIGKTTYASLCQVVNFYESNTFNINNPEILQSILYSTNSRNSESLSNGCLMRNTPLAVLFYSIYQEKVEKIFKNGRTSKYYKIFVQIRQLIEKDVQLTHPNREVLIGTGIYHFMLANVLSTPDTTALDIFGNIQLLLNEIFFKEKDPIYGNLQNILNNMSSYELDVKKCPLFDKIDTSHMGYYLHALNLIFFYLQKLEKLKENAPYSSDLTVFQKIMFDICDLGGDTDTNCCIVASIIGPLLGYESFQEKYLNDLIQFIPVKRFSQNPRDLFFSPGLIVLYVYSLEKRLENKTTLEKNPFEVIKMLLRLLTTEENSIENIIE